MKKHRWVKVEEDLRRYMDEPRPFIHQCTNCNLYRMRFNFDGEWKTFYGQPYKATKKRPECK